MEDLSLLHTGPFGVNTWIVQLNSNYVMVVDPADCKFTGDENTVVNFLSSNSLTPTVILLTHGHFDHISGLSTLKKIYPSVPIAVHKDDADCIGKQGILLQKKSLEIIGLLQILPAVSSLPEADILLENSDTLDKTAVNQQLPAAVVAALSEWKVLYTPGHSPGSVCYYNKQRKILFSGDTLFFHSSGRTDLYRGNEQKINQSLEFLARTIPPDVRVFPGHDNYNFTMGENFPL